MSLSFFGKKSKGTKAARSGFMGQNRLINMSKAQKHKNNARGRRRAKRFFFQ